MRLSYEIMGHIILGIGIVLSLIGMLSNTGLVKLHLPHTIMYLGYVLLIGGMGVLHIIAKYGPGMNVSGSTVKESDEIEISNPDVAGDGLIQGNEEAELVREEEK